MWFSVDYYNREARVNYRHKKKSIYIPCSLSNVWSSNLIELNQTQSINSYKLSPINFDWKFVRLTSIESSSDFARRRP